MSVRATAVFALACIIASGVAIALVCRGADPKCTPGQLIEVRAMARECLVHTNSDFCWGRAESFVRCER